MHIVIFWIKVGARRILQNIKQHTSIFVLSFILLGAFIAALPYIQITPNVRMLTGALIFLCISAAAVSLKEHKYMAILTLYAKSRLQNRHIIIRHYIKQSLYNNVFVIIAAGIFVYRIPALLARAIIIIAVSCALSFVLMLFRHNHTKKKKQVLQKTTNPYIQSILRDYFSPDFAVHVLFGLALSLAILIGSRFLSNDTEGQFLLVGMLAILSFMFLGIIDAIQNVHWKFYSILCPHTFLYHTKKALAIFLVCFFPLIIASTLIIAPFGFLFTLKYLFCAAALLLFAIHNALTLNNVLTKCIKHILFTVVLLWTSAHNSALFLILIMPLLFMAVLAKIDFKERYLL